MCAHVGMGGGTNEGIGVPRGYDGGTGAAPQPGEVGGGRQSGLGFDKGLKNKTCWDCCCWRPWPLLGVIH